MPTSKTFFAFSYHFSGVGLPVHKVINGETYKYFPKFNVPALVPNFEINGCMRLDYTLKFDVGFIRPTNGIPKIVCSLEVTQLVFTS